MTSNTAAATGIESTISTVIEDLKEDVLIEILSYFRLSGLDEFRKVSKSFLVAATRQKTFIYSHLKIGTKVEIIELQSAAGRSFNGRIGTLSADLHDGRFPVKIYDLTGEHRSVKVKAKNLNYAISNDQNLADERRLAIVKYTIDAKVRVPHGMLLDEIFMQNRWGANYLNGLTYFQGDFNSFMRLSRGDPRVQQANANVYTFYNVKPSLAGYSSGDKDLSILDMTVATLVTNSSMIIQHFGKKAKWHKDGPNGELVARNMVRFMKSWETERIYSKFWVVRVAPGGTLLVSENDDGNLENVYLAKGLGSQIAELFPPDTLPVAAFMTLIPIYDFLVYDGIATAMMVGRQTNASKKKKILEMVETAIRTETLIYQGKSASMGLWDSEPPALPTIDEDKGKVDWSGVEDAESTKMQTVVETTDEQKQAAMEIAKFAKKKGFKNVHDTKMTSMESVLIVRRFAYSKKENPDCMCGFMFNEKPAHFFSFKNWPTYTLEELLRETLVALKQLPKMPKMLWVDEKSLVQALQDILRDAFDEIGVDCIRVQWYPPPSPEEDAFNKMHMR